VQFHDRVKESCSAVRSFVGILRGDEVCTFRHLVNYNEYHVPFSFTRRREWSSKVLGNFMPSLGRYFQSLQRSTWPRIDPGFVTLTGGAATTVCFGVLAHTVQKYFLDELL
jgi:hypothetical protein